MRNAKCKLEAKMEPSHWGVGRLCSKEEGNKEGEVGKGKEWKRNLNRERMEGKGNKAF